MIEFVISGGQTGADQAGWRAAKAAGILTGGWMPKGFMTEDGPRPEFAQLYRASEHGSRRYPPRTRDNVRWSDLTIVFDTSGGGSIKELGWESRLAIKAAIVEGKSSLTVFVDLGKPIDPRRPLATAGRIQEIDPEVINIAGNRESKSPGIGAWVETYLTEVFRLLEENI